MMDTRFGKKLRAIRRGRRMAMIDVAGPMGWSTPYLSDIETGRKKPPPVERIGELARILEAEEQLPELLELAMRRRGSVVFPIGPAVQADVAFALLELWEAFREGKVDASIAWRIREALQSDTAAA
jgi:transcriptional regulator with XRE-family HTH domain